MQPDRQQALTAWVAHALGASSPVLEPASADASFRRYFRTSVGGRSYIVMDAPPSQADCRPFVRIAALLREAGVHTPTVHAQDLDRGFLLLDDLGKQTYLDVLNPENADALFDDALQALIRWQQASRPGMLPPYDQAFLHRELMYYPDWYVAQELKLKLSSAEMQILQDAFRLLEDSALAQPNVYVHRDYMPRNLMLSEPNPGVLDFQDALYGPISYDAVSLFRDAFLSWPEEQVREWRGRYHAWAREAGLPVQEAKEFGRAFDWMGMQRHLKIVGLFARIQHRDGKPQYLKDVPRFLGYLRQVGSLYKEFTPLLKLLDSLEDSAERRVTA